MTFVTLIADFCAKTTNSVAWEEVDEIKIRLIYLIRSILLFKVCAFIVSVCNEAFPTKTWASKEFVVSLIYDDDHKS